MKPYTTPSPPKHPEKTLLSPSKDECPSEVSTLLFSAEFESLENGSFSSLPIAKNGFPFSDSDTASEEYGSDDGNFFLPLNKEDGYEQNGKILLSSFTEDKHPHVRISPSSLAEERCPKNNKFQILPPRSNELQDEDEFSLLNSSIPLLPPPMPSLQLISHLPFPPSAPLACSTCRVSSPPKSLVQDNQHNLEAQQSRSNKRRRKQLNLCVPQSCKKSKESNLNEKRKGNMKVKEMMFKQRQMKRSASITMKPKAINVEEYRPSNKSQS